ncbi:MAG: hypothetical protein K0S26_2995 [Bacteroidota bacterium]|jgi:hypothetical protein|nr:hypothetical protein [Bacteroidota bacterium]
MGKEIKKRYFQGYNRNVLEAEVEKFKIELGDRFVNVTLTSTNPQYVIVVEYCQI